MRGDEERQAGFIVMTTLEDVVPADHPLRAIRAMVDAALEKMSPELEALYASGGRPSIAPEYLLRAQLMQILYAIPSERRLVEQLRYNLLLRWFVGLPLDEPLFHVTSFTKNRERLLRREIAEAFFVAIRDQAEAHKLLCREHFSVDGTLIEAAAALKSLRPIDEDEGEEPPASGGGRNPDVDFHGAAPRQPEPPLDDRPRGAPGAQGARQGGQALLRRPQPDREPPRPDRECELTQASGTAEREAGLRLRGASSAPRRARALERRRRQGLRHGDFVAGVRELGVTPHVAAQGALQRHRRAHDAARRLRHKPAAAQAHRGGLRLDEGHRRPAQAAPPRQGQGRRPLHLHLRGLQPGAPANLAGGAVSGLGKAQEQHRQARQQPLRPPP